MSLISMSLLSAPFISALPNFIANFAATLMILISLWNLYINSKISMLGLKTTNGAMEYE